jgi:2-dehydropantoate 2-reductase
MLTTAGSPLTASMARDIENHNPIEADHIIGDLIRRGERTGALPDKGLLFRLAYTHLKAYEAREERSRSKR